jgi:AraC family transcriptional activator of pobA
MSISQTETFQYQADSTEPQNLHFSVHSIRLDTYCVANQNEVSDNYKIFFIEDGSGTYQIDFQSISIKGAGIFCLSPGQIFSVQHEQVKKGFQISFDREFYCVETHGQEIACNGVLFNNVHRATMIPLKSSDTSLFRSLIGNMIDELQESDVAQRAMLEAYLRIFLIQALRRWGDQKPSNQEPETNHLAADFIALVEKHFREIHSVSEYAERLYIAPKSLAKRLKALGYKTPTEIIHDRILLQAKRDLRFTGKSSKGNCLRAGI